MVVTRLNARDFRTYERLDVDLGESLTVVAGDNGAGKTNLLEALYFGCVGRSCRTRVDAQAIRFGCPTARVEVEGFEPEGDRHQTAVAVDRKTGKTFFADGAKVERLDEFDWRPPVAVFMPDRLELVKGAPGNRRAHVDQLVAALWPARRATRRAYAEALAQRNALIARAADSRQLDVWDLELARSGVALTADRAAAIASVRDEFAEIGARLGLAEAPALRYRCAAGIDDEDADGDREVAVERFVDELARRRAGEAARGFTTYGPHRDELVLKLAGQEVRTYGSQGQQRLTLLALLLAECSAIAELTGRQPLILLDDVMSELDSTRRRLLVDHVVGLGQVLITATEPEHVPDAEDAALVRVGGAAAVRVAAT